MLYLNGEIAAAYWQGHWHYAAYLGDVLVWDGLHRKRGEARNVIAFAATAAGVTALVVPTDAAAQLRLLSSAEGKGMPFGAGQGDGALAFQVSAEGMAVLVEKNLISELLTLTSSGNAVPVDGGISKAGEALTLMQNANGVGAATVPGAGGENLTLTQSSEGVSVNAVPAEGGGEANFSGAGEGVSADVESGAGTEPLTIENSAAPVAATLGDATAALGLRLVSRAEGRAYAVGWEYPVQDGETLRVTQVYGALQESDGTLTLDAPVSGKVVKEQDGIAWIIPDGTEDWDWFNGNIRVTAARQETKRVAFRNDSGETINAKVYGVGEAIVSPEALADNARPMGYIALDDTVLGRAEDLIDTYGANVWMYLMSPPVSLSNWPAGELRVFTAYGGSYSGEYPYPESSTHMRDQTLLSIRVERG